MSETAVLKSLASQNLNLDKDRKTPNEGSMACPNEGLGSAHRHGNPEGQLPMSQPPCFHYAGSPCKVLPLAIHCITKMHCRKAMFVPSTYAPIP
jgi:hypothetical protein